MLVAWAVATPYLGSHWSVITVSRLSTSFDGSLPVLPETGGSPTAVRTVLTSGELPAWVLDSSSAALRSPAEYNNIYLCKQLGTGYSLGEVELAQCSKSPEWAPAGAQHSSLCSSSGLDSGSPTAGSSEPLGAAVTSTENVPERWNIEKMTSGTISVFRLT